MIQAVDLPAAPAPTTSTFFFTGFGFVAIVGSDEMVELMWDIELSGRHWESGISRLPYLELVAS